MTAELTTLARQRWAENYRMDIRAVVRGLWSGTLNYWQAWDQMDLAIRRGLPLAWQDGSAECGILPSEWTAEERQALQSAIAGELGYVDGFLTAIEDGSKANGGKLGPLFVRADLWISRYNDVKTRAAALACPNRKKVWRLGMTERHCRTCLGFEGRVYRYETWNANALPKSRRLCCRGFRCDCRLEDTDARVTPGRFPASLLC